MDKIKVGVIGAGRIGYLHAKHLQYHIPAAEVVAVADINLKTAKKVAEELNAKTSTQDYRDITESGEIDAVLICTATDTHAEIIKNSAENGKDIFCEKPIDTDIDRIKEIAEVVEDYGVKFQVGFNRRFDPNFMAVKKAISDGVVGNIHFVHIISRDPTPPPLEYIKVSGGIFLDMTIHDFDMIRYLTGEEVVEIYVTGGVMIDSQIGDAGDIDTAFSVLKLKNGCIATIDNSRKSVYGYDQRVEVFGSGGAIQTENNYPYNAVLSDAKGIHRPCPLNFFMDRYIQSYINEIDVFIKSIQKDTLPPVSAKDGLVAIVIAEAAKKSYEENKPVRIEI